MRYIAPYIPGIRKTCASLCGVTGQARKIHAAIRPVVRRLGAPLHTGYNSLYTRAHPAGQKDTA
jgi:hypothetical protein